MSLGNSKSRLESTRLSYLYMDQLLCPLRQRCHWCCTNWAEHLDHHQARKLSSTKPSEGFTADGGSWGQRPLAVPFRYGRDAPRSDDLREIRIGPRVQYSLVAIAKSVVLKTGEPLPHRPNPQRRPDSRLEAAYDAPGIMHLMQPALGMMDEDALTLRPFSKTPIRLIIDTACAAPLRLYRVRSSNRRPTS